MNKYTEEVKLILKDSRPETVIDAVNTLFPEFKGLCYYCKNEKKLKSRDIRIAAFYFDPYHCVLQVADMRKAVAHGEYTVEELEGCYIEYMTKGNV